ncbi:hypothetical protein RDABS01_003296, partial [Bienertia sinuspersici]
SYWVNIFVIPKKVVDQGNIWAPHEKGYNVFSAYRWLSPHVHDVEWANCVWNRNNIPKHRFILWTIMWGRLRTRAKLAHFLNMPDNSYAICQQRSGRY